MEKTNFYNIYRWTEEDEESDEESEDDSDDSGEDSDDESDDSDDEVEEEPFYPQPPKLAYREFFNLILTCLKGHDEQRDILLTSLHKQLAHFVRSSQDVSASLSVCLFLDETRLFHLIANLLNALYRVRKSISWLIPRSAWK